MSAAPSTPRPHLPRIGMVFDTMVRPRGPRGTGIACACSLGVTGAVRIGFINGELRRLGAARGAMPFPFISVTPTLSVLAWVSGIVAWITVVTSVVAYVVYLVGGADAGAEDITGFAGQLLLLAPLWLTSRNTARRLRTAQHLTGSATQLGSPTRLAALTCALPPLGIARLQREANRAWSPWTGAGA